LQRRVKVLPIHIWVSIWCKTPPSLVQIELQTNKDGDELDILVQKCRNKKAAMKFFKKLLKGQQTTPLKIVTDKLRSYSAAKRNIMPSVEHST
jgi:hypothetical protein